MTETKINPFEMTLAQQILEYRKSFGFWVMMKAIEQQAQAFAEIFKTDEIIFQLSDDSIVSFNRMKEEVAGFERDVERRHILGGERNDAQFKTGRWIH